MMVIGVIGGIASGKSFVAELFERWGAVRLDADRVGHDVLRLPEIRSRLVARWGVEVLGADGEIDRSRVASRVFGLDEAHRGELEWLESVVHPEIEQRLSEELVHWSRQPDVPAIVLDAAVMVKAGWHRLCHRLVFVDADEAARWERAAARGWSDEEWRRREQMQTPLSEKRRLADAVIDNSGTREATERQAFALWRSWGLRTFNGG